VQSEPSTIIAALKIRNPNLTFTDSSRFISVVPTACFGRRNRLNSYTISFCTCERWTGRGLKELEATYDIELGVLSSSVLYATFAILHPAIAGGALTCLQWRGCASPLATSLPVVWRCRSSQRLKYLTEPPRKFITMFQQSSSLYLSRHLLVMVRFSTDLPKLLRWSQPPFPRKSHQFG
jgi:hypothetical protein